MKTASLINVRNLNIYYNNFLAVKNINIDIFKRSVIACIGPSGCGKSTFLRTLNRMHEVVPGAHVKGKVLLEGSDIYASNIDPVVIRSKIGMVFQKPNPFPTMSIKENVLIGVKLKRKHISKNYENTILENALRSANLWKEVKNRLNKSSLSLSGGQQQRLCIARAIAVKPKVILMDEPCSALDPISTLAVEDLINELKSRYTVIIVTHNMQQAARVSDKTAFFNVLPNSEESGQLIEYADTSIIFNNPKRPETEDYVSGRFG